MDSITPFYSEIFVVNWTIQIALMCADGRVQKHNKNVERIKNIRIGI